MFSIWAMVHIEPDLGDWIRAKIGRPIDATFDQSKLRTGEARMTGMQVKH